MSDEHTQSGEPIGESQAAPGVQLRSTSRKPALWLEVGVILMLAVAPDMFQAFYAYFQPRTEASGFWYQYIWLFIRSAQVSAPLLLILWLKREDWSAFGIKRFRFLIDLPLAAVATLLVMFGWSVLWHVMAAASSAAGDDTVFGMNDPALNPEPDELFYYSTGIGAYCVMTIGHFANGFAEELVMRAYLITRLTTLLGSPISALILSTALFALYHCYQGPIGVVGAGFIGLVFGVVFLLTRRLWPIVLAHAATNLLIAAGV